MPAGAETLVFCFGWWFRGGRVGFERTADATGAGRGAIPGVVVSHSGSMMAVAQAVQAAAATGANG